MNVKITLQRGPSGDVEKKFQMSTSLNSSPLDSLMVKTSPN